MLYRHDFPHIVLSRNQKLVGKEMCIRARYVELELEEVDGVFSDNYVDITTPEGVEVSLPKTELPEGCTLKNLERQIRVRSVADSYEVG